MKITKKTNTRRGDRVKSTEQKERQLHKKSLPQKSSFCKYQRLANIAADLSCWHLSRVSPGSPECTYHFSEFLKLIEVESYFLQLAHFHQRKEARHGL